MIDLDAIVDREMSVMGRLITVLTFERKNFTDVTGVEHEVWLVVYDASILEHHQTRWAVYCDGEQSFSGIVSSGPWS